MNVGTQYKFEKKSNWWIHCMTSNYLSRWYVLRVWHCIVVEWSGVTRRARCSSVVRPVSAHTI